MLLPSADKSSHSATLATRNRIAKARAVSLVTLEGAG